MEYPGKEKFNDRSVETDAMDGVESKHDAAMSSLYMDDAFGTSAEMISGGWFSSPVSIMNDLLCSSPSPSFFMSPINVASTSFSPSFGANQYSLGVTVENGGDCLGSSSNLYNNGDKSVFRSMDSRFPFPTSCSDDKLELVDKRSRFVPRSPNQTLPEKLLTALHLFKEEAVGGILAQVWLPLKNGDKYILSTCEQPYLLDQTFSGYREISRLFTFSAESKPGSIPGLPGRVFSSKIPEWTSNLLYYNKAEYLRIQYAVDFEVRGSIALPVLECDSVDTSCCAVLELVTRKEKSNFDSEIENVCRVLQSVNLRSVVPPRLYLQNLSKGQRAALSDIADVLRSVCHVHRLPLALTWIPCIYTEELGEEIIKIQPRGCSSSSSVNGKYVLCVEDTASYVNDKNMKGFVHACLGHYLEEGQGVSGKALKSAHPFFCPDVKEYDISEYPLVHHARKFGLNAAVAIRLRSTHTENDDYILEFFLPVNVTEGSEQQLLLNNLSTTMQRICTSLRTVSDTELLYRNVSKAQSSMETRQIGTALRSGAKSELRMMGGDEDGPCLQTPGPKKPNEKKRSAAEKHVSLNVLQQYFSGSLKDAAKSIGVCPTTLKRICREHGIARWPSRKINKVNRSLRKLQGVIDSVGGVKGGLEFDTSVGVFGTSFFVPEFTTGKGTDCFIGESNSVVPDGKSASKPSNVVNIEMNTARTDARSHLPSPGPSSIQWALSTHGDGSSNPNNNSQNLISLVVCDDATEAKPEHGGGGGEDKQTISSNNTSEGSDSMIDGSCSSSRSFQKHNPGTGASSDRHGSMITIKSSYKEDTVRFKFDPSLGCCQLYETIAMRFKLDMGQFQLKYLDDEDEWIVLVNDSDLWECLEVLELQGIRHVKITVCDVACNVGSSGASNCFLEDNL